MLTLIAKINSRYGHDDSYTFSFERDRLTISRDPNKAICVWREDLDWEGQLDYMLNEDPFLFAIFPRLIEHLWKSWRNGDILGDGVNAELQEIITWLNRVTTEKPKSDFWQQYF